MWKYIQVKDNQNHTELDYINTGDENESTAIYRDLVNELVNKKCEKSQKALIFPGYRADIL